MKISKIIFLKKKNYVKENDFFIKIVERIYIFEMESSK